jgi:23S rRNA (adenine2503-C2)-methyltransferase
MVDFDVTELAALFERWRFKSSHARTVLREFYGSSGRFDFPWRVIGKELAAKIEREIPLRRSSIAQRTQSSDGTVKLLVNMHGGGAVESVLMPAHDPTRAAGCVSSQIGCAMGCDFCASTRRGLERNLEAGEIVEQFLHLKYEAAQIGRRLKTIVFMGMGEPMHNLDNVIAAVKRIADPDMGNLGWRQVTISTVGIVPGIERLIEADLNVHLALSLHAPDDETRSKIVPMNRRYPVSAIIAATSEFFARTRR